MKQRITVEQLNELTDEQKDKLREWWEPEEGDWYSYTCVYIHTPVKEYGCTGVYAYDYDKGQEPPDFLPLLSIGQCIGLLNTSENYKGDVMSIEETGTGWAINKPFSVETIESSELIDALWDAIKQAL